MAPADREARDLVEEVVAAHGGADRWRSAAAVEVQFSSGGLAFASKGQARALQSVTAEIGTTGQNVRLAGSAPTSWEHRFAGGGEISAALARPPGLRNRARWSLERVAAFAAAAIWTYTSLPFVLDDDHHEVERLADRAGHRRLAVRFSGHVATHSPRQVLWVDGEGLIRRHDYTALAFGRWADAAQAVTEYRSFDGIVAPTRRRVTPRAGNRPLPGPTLVWIEVENLRLVDR